MIFAMLTLVLVVVIVVDMLLSLILFSGAIFVLGFLFVYFVCMYWALNLWVKLSQKPYEVRTRMSAEPGVSIEGRVSALKAVYQHFAKLQKKRIRTDART